jgi:hypothetical protein
LHEFLYLEFILTGLQVHLLWHVQW